jgi:hypothetical protein
MTELTQQSMFTLRKRFLFRGGSVRRWLVREVKGQTIGVLVLTAYDQQAKKKVRLKFTMHRVEEYRLQRRPGTKPLRLTDVQFGFFGAFVYFNLDAFPEDGPPKVMDFRASDCFIAGMSLWWEEVASRTT